MRTRLFSGARRSPQSYLSCLVAGIRRSLFRRLHSSRVICCCMCRAILCAVPPARPHNFFSVLRVACLCTRLLVQDPPCFYICVRLSFFFLVRRTLVPCWTLFCYCLVVCMGARKHRLAQYRNEVSKTKSHTARKTRKMNCCERPQAMRAQRAGSRQRAQEHKKNTEARKTRCIRKMREKWSPSGRRTRPRPPRGAKLATPRLSTTVSSSVLARPCAERREKKKKEAKRTRKRWRRHCPRWLL